ncbi:uncharacterized protein LOC126687750 [Mercurialis annua]|uniref:uncharacterized protein LOC126687750 n=1 Tax=Mercurialis annua TaxID=3986 RepID=UPI002160B86B|nr:uncharacterized protein LOC126687750 [Mercurialis annua]
MALRSRQRAFEMLRGNPCESYKSLPNFLYMLGTTNPGSAIDTQLREDNTILYVFTALKVLIKGRKYCKPIIVVDCTFLKATLGGTLLVVTAEDAVGKLFALAFSVVDSENDASRKYFFTKLKQAFGIRQGSCIVSDRHLNIESVVKKIYPEATHAAKAYTESEFEYHIRVGQLRSIVHARELPITTLLMHIHDLQQEYSYKHRKIEMDTVTTITKNHEDLLFQNYINSLKLQVKPSTHDIITVL